IQFAFGAGGCSLAEHFARNGNIARFVSFLHGVPVNKEIYGEAGQFMIFYHNKPEAVFHFIDFVFTEFKFRCFSGFGPYTAIQLSKAGAHKERAYYETK